MITGFLGGLTTFSTFSAESIVLLQHGEYGWFLGHTGLHLFGAILLCIAGFATYRALTSWFQKFLSQVAENRPGCCLK